MKFGEVTENDFEEILVHHRVSQEREEMHHHDGEEMVLTSTWDIVSHKSEHFLQ